MTEELGTAVFSDGWTTVDHHPIVNVIMVEGLCRVYGWVLQGCFRVDPESVTKGTVFCVSHPLHP